MKEEVKQKMMQQIEVALTKLNHVPYIVSKRRRMAVWSDIRETLFLRCIHPRCSVVLSVLKSHLKYPASEKYMHPCTPSEQLQFMKQYIVISTGTILVDLNALSNRFELMTLYDMIKIKHDLSDDEVIKSCNGLTELKRQEKHFQKCTENPLRNLTKKVFLPSVQRKSAKGDKYNPYRDERPGALIKSVLYNSFGEEASNALVPMFLLRETYPASLGFLEEAVRLFILGRCEQSNLKSVCQSSMEEGYQFSRFMAMQYGFEKQWPCMTSNSLLISWAEFWQSSSQNKDIRVVPNVNVSVVTLNCKERHMCTENITQSHAVHTKDFQQSGNKEFNAKNESLKCSNGNLKMKSKALTTYCHTDEKQKQMEVDMGDESERENINKDQGIVSKQQALEDDKDKLTKCRPHGKMVQDISRNKKKQNLIKEKFQLKLPDVNITNRTIQKESSFTQGGTKASKSLQNIAHVEKRVTRSRSQNCVDKDLGKEPSKGTRNKFGPLNKLTEVSVDPDANNSAVYDIVNNEKNLEDTKNMPLGVKKIYVIGDTDTEQYMSTESQESNIEMQGAFGSGNIEVSITPKKKLMEEDETVHVTNHLPMEVDKGDKRQNDRKRLKISSAKFADKIPDVLRVNKHSRKADICSLVERKQLTPRKVKSPTEKHGDRSNTPDSVRLTDDKTPTAKSLELNVPELCFKPDAKVNESFLYKARKVKHMHKKEIVNKDTDLFPGVNGVKVQRSPVKLKDRSLCKSAGILPGPVNQIPCKPKSACFTKTGKLAKEIVSNLKQQATNSICSVIGNSNTQTLKDLVASGTEIVSPRKSETPSPQKVKTKIDTNSSYFQAERITMWKDKLETNSSVTQGGRNCKSADVFHSRERKWNYRPTSSIYNPSYSGQTYKGGPSIKTGICVLLSRDKIKSPHKTSPTKETLTKATVSSKQKSPSPKKANQDAIPKKDEVDVPNYGSSSSKTPDIYDEFARKTKPKAFKPDLQVIKGKKITYEQAANVQSTEKSGEKAQAVTKKSVNLKTSQHSSPISISANQRKSNERKMPCETKNVPLTSTLYKILGLNLTEPKYLFERSKLTGLEVKNESNSNQYSACSMCKHESNTKVISKGCNNKAEIDDCAALSASSSLVAVHTDSSKMSFSSENSSGPEVIGSFNNVEKESGEYVGKYCFPEVKTEIPGNGLSITGQGFTNSHSDSDTSAMGNKRITLLDKMNLFADGMWSPKESESLENIEKIKSIIKLNPVDPEPVAKALPSNNMEIERCKYVREQIQEHDDFQRDVKINNTLYRTIRSCKPDDLVLNNYSGIKPTYNHYQYLGNPVVSVHNFKATVATENNQSTSEIPQTKLPHTQSLTTFNRAHPRTYYRKLSLLRHEVEDQALELAREIRQSTENIQVEETSDSLLHLSDDTCNEVGDQSPSEENLIIDTFAYETEEQTEKVMQEPSEMAQISEHTQEITHIDLSHERNLGPKIKSPKIKSPKENDKKFTSRTKSFREVVEEKRAAKKKTEMEFSKKKFWKSASPEHKSKDGGLCSSRHSVKPSKLKKTVIKTLSEAETIPVIPAYEKVSKKKKRPKTCTIRTEDRNKPLATETTGYEVRNSKSNVSEMAKSKSTYAKVAVKDDLIKKSASKEVNAKKKCKTKARPKTVETKRTTSDRNLRTRTVKSARTTRKSSKHLSDDYNQDNELKLEKNKEFSVELSTGNPKSIARQKKLRSKVHESLVNRQNIARQLNESTGKDHQEAINDEEDVADVAGAQSHEEIDESYIVCETIPFENILEVNADSQLVDDADLLTKTFITQCTTHDLQEDDYNHPMNELSITESNIHPFANCNDNTALPENMTNSSHNANAALDKDLTEIGHSEEIPQLDAQQNPIVEDIVSQYMVYQDEYGEFKQVDLSELPQSVLEVVLSDNLLEMDSSVPIHFDTNGEQFSLKVPSEKLHDDSIFHDDKSEFVTDGKEFKNSYCAFENDDPTLINHCDDTDKTTIAARQDIVQGGVVQNKTISSSFAIPLQSSDYGGHISDVTDNGITVMHPNGTKVVLTVDHPAFAMFSDIFVKQEKDTDELKEGDTATYSEVPSDDNHQLQSGIEEADCVVNMNDDGSYHLKENTTIQYKSVFLEEPIAIEIDTDQHSKCQNKQPLDKKTMNPDKELFTKKAVAKCFESSVVEYSENQTKPKTFFHGENIFDTLTAELNKMKQMRINSAQVDLFPETIADSMNMIEIVNDEADFEEDLIKMIRENMEAHLSSKNGGMKDNTSDNDEEDIVSYPPVSTQISTESLCSSENLLKQIDTNYSSENPTNNDWKTEICNLKKTKKKFIYHPTYSSESDISLQSNPLIIDLSNNDALLDSDSDSSRTIEYGVESHSKSSIANDTVSEYDDSSDADYFPDYEESEISVMEGGHKVMNTSSSESSVNDERQTEKHKKGLLKSKKSCHGNMTSMNKQEVGSKRERNMKAAFVRLPPKCKNETFKTSKIINTDLLSSEVKHQTKDVAKKTSPVKLNNEDLAGSNASSLRNSKNDNQDSKVLDSEDELGEEHDHDEDTLTANNLVTMQKLYFDILKNSSGKEKSTVTERESTADSAVDVENILSDRIPLKRDRDITRAESDAEKMKEGTGSLEELERDDADVKMIEDLTNNCCYQVVEDEDGITLGGVVYYNEYVLPFVYINGYKFTPLKDAATLFQPDCCAWKCRIPKNIMTRNKRLIKTFSTWEQVYKLELIKMKKGPAVKTGDTLVRLDNFVSLLPSLLLDIIAEHKDSKLKYSQDCDMKSYMHLRKRLKDHWEVFL